MKRALVFLMVVLVSASTLSAQKPDVPLYGIFVRSSRVAVLPFVNYTDSVDISDVVNAQVREQLGRREVEMADEESQSELLRMRRIRNTLELTETQLQVLADELQVSYILSGSVDRYLSRSGGAELALSARLIYVPTREIVWTSTSVINGQNTWWPLGLGRRPHAANLLTPAVRRLLKRFDYQLSPGVRPVESLRGISGQAKPLKRLAVVTLANESSIKFAGHIVSNHLITELISEGFHVTDPGLVRDVMLSENKLTLGSVTSEVLARLGEKLGADAVLTGTVSEFADEGFDAASRQVKVAMEARLIDSRTDELLWGKTLTATSRRNAIGFGWGDVESLMTLSRSVTSQLVHSIPVERGRRVAAAEVSVVTP